RAIAAAGVRRRPAQTTLEFVQGVLSDLRLDEEALDRLAHLYRRALFDARPLDEDARDSALACLDLLTADLDSSRTRQARSGSGGGRCLCGWLRASQPLPPAGARALASACAWPCPWRSRWASGVGLCCGSHRPTPLTLRAAPPPISAGLRATPCRMHSPRA